MTPILGFVLGLYTGGVLGVFVTGTLQDDFHFRDDWWLLGLIALMCPAVFIMAPMYWHKRRLLRIEDRWKAITDLERGEP
jgi:hypothetical protein